MGSSHSTDKLELPLYAQSPAVLATATGVVASQFTSLCVMQPSVWSSTLQVTDAQTQQHMYDFKAKSFSSRCTLQTPDGRPLASIKRKTLSSHYRLYEGGEQEDVALEIRVEGFGHTVIFADFYDRLAGRMCRVLLDGNTYDRVVLFYIEYGQPDLLPKPRRRDLVNSHRFQVIGRIRTPHGKLFSTQEHFVEAAPGVDLTLFLLLWRVRKDHQDEEERRRRSPD